ncbi:MAG TPA: DUF3093 domain-containing protein [Pseudonocardiaceae bacterium]
MAEHDTKPAGEPVYRERLYLQWWHWILPLIAAGIIAAEVHMGYPGVRAWLPYLITIPLTALMLWRFGHAKVEVRDGELWAGEAHLPLRFIDEIRIVPQAMKRRALGPGFDPAAYALHRSWVGPMLWLRLNDPDDSTPYWLISTRRPERLAEALEIARPQPALPDPAVPNPALPGPDADEAGTDR